MQPVTLLAFSHRGASDRQASDRPRTSLPPPPPQVRVVWEALLWAIASSLPGGLAARPAVRSALAALVERRLEVCVCGVVMVVGVVMAGVSCLLVVWRRWWSAGSRVGRAAG